MAITVNREHLLPALLKVVGIIERKQTLPILGNVLIQIKDNKMLLIATDSEIEIRAVSQIQAGDDDTSFTIPAKKFVDICKAMPEGVDIKISVETEQVLVHAGRSRFTLGILPAADYPSLETIEPDASFNIESKVLKRSIESTAFAMAAQDARHYLNGMLFDLSLDQLRCVSTDGHRLALCECKIEIRDYERRLLLPRKAVLELSRLLDNSDVPVSIDAGLNFCRFKMGETVFTTKLIEGKFPEYQRVIPKRLDKAASIERDGLKFALLRASILLTDRYKGIKMTFTSGNLHLQSSNIEQKHEDAQEEMEIEYTGEEVSIGFNASYILDILTVMHKDNIIIEFTDSQSSALIRDSNDLDKLYVVMPMRL